MVQEKHLKAVGLSPDLVAFKAWVKLSCDWSHHELASWGDLSPTRSMTRCTKCGCIYVADTEKGLSFLDAAGQPSHINKCPGTQVLIEVSPGSIVTVVFSPIEVPVWKVVNGKWSLMLQKTEFSVFQNAELTQEEFDSVTKGEKISHGTQIHSNQEISDLHLISVLAARRLYNHD